MVMPNVNAHMSPKDRIRSMASQVETLPGWSLNDPVFFSAFNYPEKISLIRQVHAAIKAHHFFIGGTHEEWEAITYNPSKFNQLWRKALNISPDDAPPPLAFRQVVPKPSLILKQENFI
jgi:hypothetical protein